MKGKKYRFSAVLEVWAQGMDYGAVPVPSRITKSLGVKKAVLVLAQVNDSKPFKVSLFPAGQGQHYIRIKSKVRKEVKVALGDRIKIEFLVLDRSDIQYPKDLLMALRQAGLTSAFKALTPGKQNYLVRRIEEVIKPEARQRRIEEAIKVACK